VAYSAQLQRNGSGEHRQPRKRQVSELRKRGGSDTLAETNNQGLQGRTQTRNIGSKRSRRNEQPERRSDLPRAAWLPEPNVGRVANGVPRRVDRLKALGNAVVPQIPEMIGRAILAAELETSQ
jgi:DNA (cytosine-5)-methyltransferase 1